MDTEKCWFYVVEPEKEIPKIATFSAPNILDPLVRLKRHLIIIEMLENHKILNLKEIENN